MVAYHLRHQNIQGGEASKIDRHQEMHCQLNFAVIQQITVTHNIINNYSICGPKWSVKRRRKKMDDWLTVWPASASVRHLFLLPTSLLGLGPPMERVICQLRKFTVTGHLLLKWKPQHVSSKRHCSHVRGWTLADWIHLCTGATASA